MWTPCLRKRTSGTAYSGCDARHLACVSTRRTSWHEGFVQARCRLPTRGSGVNQQRQYEHGRFRMRHRRRRGRRHSAKQRGRPRGVGPFWRAEAGLFSRALTRNTICRKSCRSPLAMRVASPPCTSSLRAAYSSRTRSKIVNLASRVKPITSAARILSSRDTPPALLPLPSSASRAQPARLLQRAAELGDRTDTVPVAFEVVIH